MTTSSKKAAVWVHCSTISRDQPSKKLATDGHFPYNPSPCEFPSGDRFKIGIPFTGTTTRA
jgi:hypothetical protein